MSYDSWFYRTTDGLLLTNEALRLLADKKSDKAGVINHDEIFGALRELFGSEIVVEKDGIHGPFFSILLKPGAGAALVMVNCSRSVTERPDIFERVVAAGVRRLGAACYDRQLLKHREAAEELPEPPRLAPGGEYGRLVNDFLRVDDAPEPAEAARLLKRELEDIRQRFPDDPAMARLYEKVLRTYPD